MALARATRRQDGLALAGAALLVFGYFRAASWESSWYFARNVDVIWFVWSPIEAFGAAFLVALAVLASRRGRLAREAADGFLLGVGVIACAAMAAFVASEFEFAGTVVVTAAGAAAIAAAGALGLLTRRAPEVLRPAGPACLSPRVLLGFSPLVVNVASWSKTGLLEDWAGSYAIEVLVAVAAAVVAFVLLIRAPRARVRAGGALIAVGTLLVLHLVGLMFQIAKWEGVDALRLGGPLGIAGGLLLVVGASAFCAPSGRLLQMPN